MTPVRTVDPTSQSPVGPHMAPTAVWAHSCPRDPRDCLTRAGPLGGLEGGLDRLDWAAPLPWPAQGPVDPPQGSPSGLRNIRPHRGWALGPACRGPETFPPGPGRAGIGRARERDGRGDTYLWAFFGGVPDRVRGVEVLDPL